MRKFFAVLLMVFFSAAYVPALAASVAATTANNAAASATWNAKAGPAVTCCEERQLADHAGASHCAVDCLMSVARYDIGFPQGEQEPEITVRSLNFSDNPHSLFRPPIA